VCRIVVVTLVQLYRTERRRDCAMLLSPVCCATLLTLLYYYDAKAPIFAHDDPVRWGRSVLGREVVVVVYAITTLVHGWALICIPSSLVFGTSMLLYRGFVMLSIVVCALSGLACVSATTHGLRGFAGLLQGFSQLLPYCSFGRYLFLNFQLALWCLFALAEASSVLVPKSLDFACDCFFVFSSTFVLCNCLRMCRKIAAIFCTLCTNTLSAGTRGHRSKICAKRIFDI